jgi:hypothetical protein
MKTIKINLETEKWKKSTDWRVRVKRHKDIKLNLETGKQKKSGNQTVRVKRCEDDQASLETGKQRTVPTRELGLRGMKPIQFALK